MRRPILMNWEASNTFGWGLLGLNIFAQWANDSDVQPLMGFPISDGSVQCVDPLRIASLASARNDSNQFLAELERIGPRLLRDLQVVTVDALGNGFTCENAQRVGIRNVGRCIFENTRTDGAEAGLAKYDSLLCASRWNAELLRACSSKPVTMIHEGIDHAMFFPGPRSGMNAGRFFVFTGGKIEHRKAQDLALLAFREFAARHDDAVLVAAWHSPWPQVSVGFQGGLAAPLRVDGQGRLEIRRWVVENGIRNEQFVELPLMPNQMMPAILREMDCSLQVSRAEACTNLPAKEAMACGVPVILADNTGVRDLVDIDNCVALRRQTAVAPVAGCGTEGWGESSVDEVIAALELLYTDTQARKRIGARGAEWIVENGRTWRNHAAAFKRYLLGSV